MEITKVALTIAGGVGASVALVVAYRKQRDSEANRFMERFGAAAAQLGDLDPAVRLAGVYAMTTLADDSPKALWRQQCVDVLCAYLRMPYELDAANIHLIERTRTYPEVAGTDVLIADQFRFRYNDHEVRKTVHRVIVEHLRPGAEISWSSLRFDFTGATFSDVSFSGCIFQHGVEFTNAKFRGRTDFDGTQFESNAIFKGAVFDERVSFGHGTRVGESPVKFRFLADFQGAKFNGGAFFIQTQFGAMTTFGGMSGGRTEFRDHVIFEDVKFKGVAYFSGVYFDCWVTFENVFFEDDVEFDRGFGRGNPSAEFKNFARFEDVTFQGNARFDEAKFKKVVFTKPHFAQSGIFHQVDFGDGAQFLQPTSWEGMKFDWDDDLTQKPEHVKPSQWPPQVVSVT